MGVQDSSSGRRISGEVSSADCTNSFRGNGSRRPEQRQRIPRTQIWQRRRGKSEVSQRPGAVGCCRGGVGRRRSGEERSQAVASRELIAISKTNSRSFLHAIMIVSNIFVF